MPTRQITPRLSKTSISLQAFNKEVLIQLLIQSKTNGFTVDNSRIFGAPDLAFPKQKLAIVLYKCEVHQCPRCIKKNKIVPLSQIKDTLLFKEISKTVIEDEKYENKFVNSHSWGLLTVWDCQLVDTPLRVLNSIRAYLLLPILTGEEEEKLLTLRVK